MPVTQTMTFSATPPTTGETPTVFNYNAIACWNELKNTTVPNLNTAFTQMNALESNVNAKEASAVAASAAAVMAANFQGTWTNQTTVIGQSWEYLGVIYGVLVAGNTSPVATPSNWIELTTAQAIKNVPSGGISATTVQSALNELDTEKAPKASPIFTGGATISGGLNLESSIVFEGSTADAFETTLQVTNPTVARTITVPDSSGTIALLESPIFTGTPTAPTPTLGDNSTKLATTAFVIANAPSPILAEYTVAGSAVTSIDFSGLDINAHGGSYEIELRLINATASIAFISMFVNNDTTPTNYYSQFGYFSSNTVAGSRYNNAVGSLIQASNSGHSIGIISLVNGFYTAKTRSDYDAANSVQNIIYVIRKVATVTNITQLTFTASVAGAIGVGSKIIIRRKDK